MLGTRHRNVARKFSFPVSEKERTINIYHNSRVIQIVFESRLRITIRDIKLYKSSSCPHYHSIGSRISILSGRESDTGIRRIVYTIEALQKHESVCVKWLDQQKQAVRQDRNTNQ